VITNIQYQAKIATLLSQKFLMFWSFFFKNFANLQVAPEPSSLFFKRKNII